MAPRTWQRRRQLFPKQIWFLVLVLQVCVGCTAAEGSTRAAAAPQPVAARPRAAQQEPSYTSQAAGSSVRFQAQALELKLYDRARWRRRSLRPWLVLDHDRTLARFEFRRWRAPKPVKQKDCLEIVQRWRPNWSSTAAELYVDRRRLDQPAGYHTELFVWVERDAVKNELVGTAAAVGAGIGRCFAAGFNTRAKGPDATRLLADRLALGTALIESVRFLEIDSRAEGRSGTASEAASE